MNASWPEASAIAVRDGRILEVGDEDAMQAWSATDETEVIDAFAEHVILPGLIDPHLHPLMAAVLLPMQFITALEWKFPWETIPATASPAQYRAALEREHRNTPARAAFFTWGYQQHWHGDMGRPLLDEIFGERPAVVWQRSFHEVYLNTAMLGHLGIDPERIRGRHQIDIDQGHFYETGLGYAIGKLNQIIMSETWIDSGLERLRQLVHFGGHTTVGDMAVGIFDAELEWAAARRVLDQDDTPFRVLCVPHATAAAARSGNHAAALEAAAKLPEQSTGRLRFGKKIKLFTDGAFFSQLAMLQPPGYIDAHEGEWLTVPEQYIEIARLYWNAGYAIHVHCTGDLGLELAVDTLETLQWERPRFNHGYTIEHFGFSTPEQVERIKALGASVSANVYYLHELSAAYSERGVGIERAHQMARLGACDRAGIRWALHSDFPMAPAMPLHNAWVACTRENCEGEVVGPAERVSLDAALRAITIDAAAILGLQDETGSIRAGKSADFTVLNQDPYEVGAEQLKDIEIVATVFEGQVAEIERAQSAQPEPHPDR